MKNDYAKLKIAIRHYLIGKGYYKAVEALNYGLSHHIGLRKDKVTPEFQHQVEQASYFRTIDFLTGNMAETVFSVIFLHDTVEDVGGVNSTKTPLSFIEGKFGNDIAHTVWLMTNQYADGTKKAKETYYAELATNAVAAVCKGLDRMHNVGSMVGVFSKEKQASYIRETVDDVLPMLKRARNNFPMYEPIYQNLKWVLIEQMKIIQHTLND